MGRLGEKIPPLGRGSCPITRRRILIGISTDVMSVRRAIRQFGERTGKTDRH